MKYLTACFPCGHAHSFVVEKVTLLAGPVEPMSTTLWFVFYNLDYALKQSQGWACIWLIGYFHLKLVPCSKAAFEEVMLVKQKNIRLF